MLWKEYDKHIYVWLKLTCCFSDAVVMCGKTFTVTQQDEDESSTTTAKLRDKMKPVQTTKITSNYQNIKLLIIDRATKYRNHNE